MLHNRLLGKVTDETVKQSEKQPPVMTPLDPQTVRKTYEAKAQ